MGHKFNVDRLHELFSEAKEIGEYGETLHISGRCVGKTELIIHSAINASLVNPEETIIVVVKDMERARNISIRLMDVAEEYYGLKASSRDAYRIFLQDPEKPSYRTNGIKILAEQYIDQIGYGYQVKSESFIYIDEGADAYIQTYRDSVENMNRKMEPVIWPRTPSWAIKEDEFAKYERAWSKPQKK